MLNPAPSDNGTHNILKRASQHAHHSTSTFACVTQQATDTADGSTQQAPQRTRSYPQTIQASEIGQRDMVIGVIPPPVEYSRRQLVAQINEALIRGKELEQSVADRRRRTLLGHRLELAHCSNITCSRQRQSLKRDVATCIPDGHSSIITTGLNRIPIRAAQ